MHARQSAVLQGRATLPAREWRGATLLGTAEVRQIEPTRFANGTIGYAVSLLFDRSSDDNPFAPLPVYRAECTDPELNGVLAELEQEMLLHPEVELFALTVELVDIVPDQVPGRDRHGREVLCPAIDTAAVRQIHEASADGLLLRCFRRGGAAYARRVAAASEAFPPLTPLPGGAIRA